MDSKNWFNSRLIHLGSIAILGSVADGIINGYDWRQIVSSAIGALVVLLRVDTTKVIKK